MDLNMVVLAGKVAGLPEVRNEDGGLRQLRFMVTVRAKDGHTMPTIPVHLWDPDRDLIDSVKPGIPVWVAGEIAMQRVRSDVHGEMINIMTIKALEVSMRPDTVTHRSIVDA